VSATLTELPQQTRHSFSSIEDITGSDHSISVFIDQLIGEENPEKSIWKYIALEPNATTMKYEHLQDRISPEVIAFCFRLGILHYLPDVIDLIKKSFTSLIELTVEREEDPEIDDEWLVFNIFVKETVDQILADYDGYTSRFISLIPWPDSNKIRLSYNIV